MRKSNEQVVRKWIEKEDGHPFSQMTLGQWFDLKPHRFEPEWEEDAGFDPGVD